MPFNKSFIQSWHLKDVLKQCFTVSYHPASSGLVERANRKILDVLRPVVSGLQHTWEDWLAYVAASINSPVCESTGESPHYIISGIEKRIPMICLVVLIHVSIM